LVIGGRAKSNQKTLASATTLSGALWRKKFMDNQQPPNINQPSEPQEPSEPIKKAVLNSGLSIAVVIICLVASGVAVY